MNYKDLQVWQKAMSLSVDIYKLTNTFPKHELFSLVSQMRRSAVSIASNIAEGNGRESEKEFVRFLQIAKGSANELECQIMIAYRVGYLAEELQTKLIKQCDEIIKMIVSLIKAIKSKS